jgi:uncharacterized protein YcnI/copper(I)-binding protein
MKKEVATAILAAAALALAASTARAHVTLSTAEAPHGAYKAVFKVPHGCSGSPTTGIKVEIPEGVIGVKPMPKPGWTLSTEKGAYARTYDYYHGAKVSEGVKTVSWYDGKLLDEHFDEFALSVFLTDALEAGRTVYFPVTQTCETGSMSWSEIAAGGQDPHALKTPAPGVILAGGTDVQAHGPASAKSGDIAVETPWSRATPGGATVAAGYVKIANTGSKSDTLVGATFTGAGRVEIHEMSMTDGIMKMRAMPGGIEIKAGETVELAPGGMHLMLMELGAPLKEGQKIKGSLVFKNAGEIAVEFDVAPLGASGAPHSQH